MPLACSPSSGANGSEVPSEAVSTYAKIICAYSAVILTIVLIVPSTTVPGDPTLVQVRAAPAAAVADLPFSSPVTVAGIVQRRPSATSQLPDRTSFAPVRISVPRLGIDGPIVPVGIATDRQLDVPTARTAGWYRHSALPGGAGAAVIAAHVDYSGKPGLFFDLRLTAVGDEIVLEGSDGKLRTYQVTSVQLYDKTELPSSELFRSDGEHGLHLVTCGGTFDPVTRSYRGNQVVTARPV